jgi:hypothetical protein
MSIGLKRDRLLRDERVPAGGKVIAVLGLLLFVLVFMPVPLRSF